MPILGPGTHRSCSPSPAVPQSHPPLEGAQGPLAAPPSSTPRPGPGSPGGTGEATPLGVGMGRSENWKCANTAVCNYLFHT